VIDADGHSSEPRQELVKWLPKEYAQDILKPFYTPRADGFDPGPSGPYAEHINPRGRPGQTDPVQRLPDMDLEGIDVAVVFGGGIAFAVNGLKDKGFASAACHAVNRWFVEEYLPAEPKRLKGAGLIPCQDPNAAAKEIEWLAAHRGNGMLTAMVSTNVHGVNLGDRRFDPMYDTAEAAGFPLSVHPQTLDWGQYGVEGVMVAGCRRLEKYSYVHMTAFTFELMIALMHMVGEGVFDRYPKLKVAYMEGSCGWLPFWLERLDEHFEKLRPQWPDCERKPSEIIRSGQVSVTCEPEEAGIPYVLDSVASHTVMYASDYPDWDSEFPESVRKLAGVPGMTEERRRLVLGRNAKESCNRQDSELPISSVYFEEKLPA